MFGSSDSARTESSSSAKGSTSRRSARAFQSQAGESKRERERESSLLLHISVVSEDQPCSDEVVLREKEGGELDVLLSTTVASSNDQTRAIQISTHSHRAFKLIDLCEQPFLPSDGW